MYLTEAEDIQKRWQEYTEELCKKDLYDPMDCSPVGSSVYGTFLYSSSAYPCHLSLISSASVRSLLFLSLIVPIFA